MKVIAFCLFGNAPIYCQGAIRNAHLAREIYPDWVPVFWVEDSVDPAIVNALCEADVAIERYSVKEYPNGMFTRFLANDLEDLDRYIVRDVDSRLNKREATAVAEWEASGKLFHVMRDHPYHIMPIMGGAWGCKSGVIKDMNGLISRWPKHRREYTREYAYGLDQEFLMEVIWPKVRHSVFEQDFCNRDKFPDAIPFPAKLGDWRFVLEIFDEHDNPDPHHWQMRVNWMS